MQLKTLSRCPGSTGRLIVGDELDRSTGYRRISLPQHPQPIAVQSHLRTLDPGCVAGKTCRHQPRPLDCAPAVVEAGRMAAHACRLARLAQTVRRSAARHLPVRPVAEPRASSHEVFALRLGLKSEDAAGSWVSRASERFHDVIFLVRLTRQSYHDLNSRRRHTACHPVASRLAAICPELMP